jgi:hypothetical protein
MNRKRRTFLKTAGVAVMAPAITKAQPSMGDTERDSSIKANLDAVAGHFHNESVNEVEKACALYTEDIVWEAPARNLLFRNKKDVADNYRKMFASMKDVEIRNLQRFATEDRVFDDSEFSCMVTGPDFLPVPIGSKINMRLVHIFEMRKGRIAKETAFEMWKVV